MGLMRIKASPKLPGNRGKRRPAGTGTGTGADNSDSNLNRNHNHNHNHNNINSSNSHSLVNSVEGLDEDDRSGRPLETSLNDNDSIGHSGRSHRHRRTACGNHSDTTTRSNDSSKNSADFLTESRIRRFLEEFHRDYFAMGKQSFEVWSFFFDKYCSADYKFIRPSGNPLYKNDFARQLSTDTQVLKSTLVSIDSMTIFGGGKAAVVTYTGDQIFIYKGINNEDRATFTSVIELRSGKPKLVHEHRSSGKPIPKETRWESI